MNPYPFVGLNHFTVPVAISASNISDLPYGGLPNATRAAALTFAWGESSPPRLQKMREGLQRRLRDVMLDAFGVGFGGFGRHAEGAQHIDDEAMADADTVGECMAFFGQEHAAIGFCGGEAGALQTRDGLDRGGVGDAEAAGDVGRPRLAFAGQ